MHKTFFEAMNHVEHLLSPWSGAGTLCLKRTQRAYHPYLCMTVLCCHECMTLFWALPDIKAKLGPNKADHWPKRSDTSIILSYIFWISRFFECATEPQLATANIYLSIFITWKIGISLFYWNEGKPSKSMKPALLNGSFLKHVRKTLAIIVISINLNK